ncbi:MAG: hypothetical protein ACRD38_10010, partial [Nitrososphaerales archaeon]
VNAIGNANWQPESDKIWVKIRDAGELVTDSTQVIAVGHDQRVLEGELARYPLHVNVKTNDEPFLLSTFDRLTETKFDLIVDFNGDNILNGNDFRERSPFEEGKTNDAWPSFKIDTENQTEVTTPVIIDKSPSNLILVITIGLSIVAVGIAIVAIVRRRK